MMTGQPRVSLAAAPVNSNPKMFITFLTKLGRRLSAILRLGSAQLASQVHTFLCSFLCDVMRGLECYSIHVHRGRGAVSSAESPCQHCGPGPGQHCGPLLSLGFYFLNFFCGGMVLHRRLGVFESALKIHQVRTRNKHQKLGH